jgi:hypothetical protein
MFDVGLGKPRPECTTVGERVLFGSTGFTANGKVQLSAVQE